MSDKCEHKNKIIDRSIVLGSNPPQYNYQCQVCLKNGFILCSEADRPDCEVDHKQLYWGWEHHGVKHQSHFLDEGLGMVVREICPPCPKCGADLEKEVKND